MNKIEKLVYDYLKSNPRLKIFIRNLYQNMLDLFPQKRININNKIIFFPNFFFGFHDLNPFSSDNNSILAHHSDLNNVYPKLIDKLKIGIIDLESEKFTEYGHSETWNFHKGARLQWINNSEIIYNSHFIDGTFYSKIINIKNRNFKNIPYPIDSVSNNSKYFTNFSYTRLEYLMSGYGYQQLDVDNYNEEKAPSKTGLRIIDLGSHQIIHFFSIIYLVEFAGLNSFLDHYFFYVTHSSFSNNNNKVSFMLRWTKPNNTLKRYSILFVFDLNTKELKILPTDYMVSHYVWVEEKILLYSRINGYDSHYLIDTNNFNDIKFFGKSTLSSDGHQTINKNGEIVIDTYPNRNRIQKLFYFKDKNSHGQLIGEFYHPKKFQSSHKAGHICVDLHPRISSDGNFVSFDSAFNGKRNLCILKLK